MDFDYGPQGPPVPTNAEVMEALLAADLAALPAPAPPRGDERMEGLDSGRAAAVGDVVIEDIPGFIDSTLFAAMTPHEVDSVVVVGLEGTRFDTAHVMTRRAPEIDSDRANVGDVAALAAIPGIYGSDVFKAGVDIAAGAAGAGDLLDVSPARLHPRAAASVPSDGNHLTLIICTNCGSTHAKARCPSCATNHPQART